MYIFKFKIEINKEITNIIVIITLKINEIFYILPVYTKSSGFHVYFINIVPFSSDTKLSLEILDL